MENQVTPAPEPRFEVWPGWWLTQREIDQLAYGLGRGWAAALAYTAMPRGAQEPAR